MRRTPLLPLVLLALVLGLLGGAAPGPASAVAVSPRRSATPAAPAAFVAQPVAWRGCHDDYLRSARAQCGRLTVPLDPADPAGATIQVGVSRVLHSREPYRGAVFTNAGGPGGSGLFLAAYGRYVPDGVGSTYDWYGFDPRGVGSSRPRVGCEPHYLAPGDRPAYHPRTRRDLAYWLDRTQGYAAACGASATAAILAHDTTRDTVADYEVLRESIGAEQVTWYGASYGTYVGEVYATLHPDRISAMVLDGVIDPAKVWYHANLAQNVAFQKPFERFLGWLGRHPGVYHLGRGRRAVEHTYRHLRRRLARHPAGHGRLGPDELDDALLSSGYSVGAWPGLGAALSALVDRGDAAALVAMWRRGSPRSDDSAYAGYLATECTDAPWPGDWGVWAADARRTDRVGPYQSWSNTWYNAPCRTWPFPATQPAAVSGAAFTGPVLMTGQTLDPATPFAGALAARALFPTARLVAGVGGTSHAVALSGVACTDDRVADLLRDGSLPARRPGNRPDVRCPPLRPPTPAPSPSA